MRKESGGVDYDEEARLLFGNAARAAIRRPMPSHPARWNCILRRLGGECGDDAEADEAASDAEKEARLVGRRLLELKSRAASIT